MSQRLRPDVLNYTYYPVLLSGLQFSQSANPGANPTFTVELSLDNGGNWNALTTTATVDRFGRGSVSFTPTQTTAGNTALVRVTANGTALPPAVSAAPFLIADGGHSHFVN